MQKPLIYVDERLITDCDKVKQKPVWQRDADKKPEAENSEPDGVPSQEIGPEEEDVDLESVAESLTNPPETEQDSDIDEDITFV